MDGEELRRRYAAGQRDFSNLNLREVNLSGIAPELDAGAYDELCPELAADLSEINLSGANLRRAILAGANLTNANLSYANLTNANLAYCNLTNTNLSNAILIRACLDCVEFDNTNLRGANLYLAEICQTCFKADATGATNLTTVNFGGTQVRGLVLDDGTVLDSDHDW
ncbi:pentapeptide repeat-containing protein [Aphanothece hegewaldii CCALA 016]|uniref:Pentapeptide repeat-containing protein n=1 Tax=Aphanothece hegewaldii CCALA 016 TaxID=2107694 RepID=A0A2T1LQY5_9CHRO|nr:pentapeptide repeat-containing protein [Aphanothece hegewaldii]PSF30445.1 pentapeptide repeat-containing protein [Aphanothece hegewaldii CCALA 016]